MGTLTKLQGRINKQLKDLDSVSDDNPLGRIVATYYENQHLDDLETISRKLETVVIKDVAAVTAGLPVIKILATVAPLTGLHSRWNDRNVSIDNAFRYRGS